MRIVFLCVENSSRSQMAEGIAKMLFKDMAIIESAGSNPTKVNPLAIQIMAEIGIDISNQRAKSINEINRNGIDWIITLCSEEICPILDSGVNKLHWPFPNPNILSEVKTSKLKLFREVRDGLMKKINEFKISVNNKG